MTSMLMTKLDQFIEVYIPSLHTTLVALIALISSMKHFKSCAELLYLFQTGTKARGTGSNEGRTLMKQGGAVV